MDITRTNWEKIRPTAYKAGGTGKLLDAYNSPTTSEEDVVALLRDEQVAMALQENLEGRVKAAKVTDFYDEKADLKHKGLIKENVEIAKKIKEGDKKLKLHKVPDIGPAAQGSLDFNQFKFELNDWISKVKQRKEFLKKVANAAATEQVKEVTRIADLKFTKFSMNYREAGIDQMKSTESMQQLSKDTEKSDKNAERMRQAGMAIFFKSEKEFAKYFIKGIILAAAVKEYTEKYKVAPYTKPADVWTGKVQALRTETEVFSRRFEQK